MYTVRWRFAFGYVEFTVNLTLRDQNSLKAFALPIRIALQMYGMGYKGLNFLTLIFLWTTLNFNQS